MSIAERLRSNNPDMFNKVMELKNKGNQVVNSPAEEKAKELVNKHYSLISGMELSFISKLIVLPNGDSNYKTAKQCAKIAVEEIIEAVNDIFEAYDERKFWNEVLKEIENL